MMNVKTKGKERMNNQMRMEATNSFKDGLVLDFSPENTPATSLTSALNATLITFNGNEMALLNDQGNARVETARLPDGYIPLGTCEFGDIIYIVSYNPLENKSLIGCFPSPERNITSDEISDLKTALTWTDFQETDDDINPNGKLKTTSVKKLLVGERFINPGDGYIVYTDTSTLNNNRTYITDVGSESYQEGDWPKMLRISIVSIDKDGRMTRLSGNTKWYDLEHTWTTGEESNEQLHTNILNYFIKASTVNSKFIPVDIDEYRTLVYSAYLMFQSKNSGQLAILAELELIDTFNCAYNITVAHSLPKFPVTVKIDYDVPEEGIITVEYQMYKVNTYSSWTSRHLDINPSGFQYSISTGKQYVQCLNGTKYELIHCLGEEKENKNDKNCAFTYYEVNEYWDPDEGFVEYKEEKTKYYDSYSEGSWDSKNEWGINKKAYVSYNNIYDMSKSSTYERYTLLDPQLRVEWDDTRTYDISYSGYINSDFNNYYTGWYEKDLNIYPPVNSITLAYKINSRKPIEDYYYVNLWKLNSKFEEHTESLDYVVATIKDYNGTGIDITDQVNMIDSDKEELKKYKSVRRLYTDVAVHYFKKDVARIIPETFFIPIKATLSISKDISLDIDISERIDTVEITPYMPYGLLESHKKTFTIDFSKIGTEYAELTRWKYLNVGNLCTLEYGFDINLLEHEIVNNLTMEFYDDEGLQAIYNKLGASSYNGVFTEQFGLNNSSSNYRLTNVLEHEGNLIKDPTEITRIKNDKYEEGKTWEDFYAERYIKSNKLYKVVIKLDCGTLDESFQYISNRDKLYTFTRWLWTDAMYNSNFYTTEDFNDLPLLLTLGCQYQLNSNDNFALNNVLEYNLPTPSEDMTDITTASLGKVITTVDKKDSNIRNLELQVAVGFLENYGTLKLDALHYSKINIDCYTGRKNMSTTYSGVISENSGNFDMEELEPTLPKANEMQESLPTIAEKRFYISDFKFISTEISAEDQATITNRLNNNRWYKPGEVINFRNFTLPPEGMEIPRENILVVVKSNSVLNITVTDGQIIFDERLILVKNIPVVLYFYWGTEDVLPDESEFTLTPRLPISESIPDTFLLEIHGYLNPIENREYTKEDELIRVSSKVQTLTAQAAYENKFSLSLLGMMTSKQCYGNIKLGERYHSVMEPLIRDKYNRDKFNLSIGELTDRNKPYIIKEEKETLGTLEVLNNKFMYFNKALALVTPGNLRGGTNIRSFSNWDESSITGVYLSLQTGGKDIGPTNASLLNSIETQNIDGPIVLICWSRNGGDDGQKRLYHLVLSAGMSATANLTASHEHTYPRLNTNNLNDILSEAALFLLALYVKDKGLYPFNSFYFYNEETQSIGNTNIHQFGYTYDGTKVDSFSYCPSYKSLGNTIASILMQLYYITNKQETEDYYVYTNLIRPKPYTETWYLDIVLDMSVNELDYINTFKTDLIYINEKSLRAYISEVEEGIEDLSPNLNSVAIDYNNKDYTIIQDYQHIIDFQYTLSDNLEMLDNVYNNDSSTTITIYKTNGDSMILPHTFNENELYYIDDSGSVRALLDNELTYKILTWIEEENGTLKGIPLTINNNTITKTTKGFGKLITFDLDSLLTIKGQYDASYAYRIRNANHDGDGGAGWFTGMSIDYALDDDSLEIFYRPS